MISFSMHIAYCIVYLYFQMAFCIPTEVGMDVYATTQWPDYVQKGIAVITNMKNSGYETSL